MPSRPFRRVASGHEGQSKLVAINSRYRLLAVGCDNGDVHVYSIDQHLQLAYSHSLWLFPHEANASTSRLQLGSLAHLEWSPDGCALALSMSKAGGLCLWSVFGCRLSSFHDHGDHHTLPGITRFCWGPEGYSIFALANSLASREATKQSAAKPPTTTPPLNPELLRFRYVKSSLTASSSASSQSNVVLQGADRLCFNPTSIDSSDSSVARLCDLQWQSTELPSNYITEHWPIRIVSLSPDGQYLAMAGKAGTGC